MNSSISGEIQTEEKLVCLRELESNGEILTNLCIPLSF